MSSTHSLHLRSIFVAAFFILFDKSFDIAWGTRVIFIFGAARSGTTWLAKLFDSHPDLLYLHEPDITDRGTDLLPYWFERAPSVREIENARQFLARLTRRRAPRTVGIQPFFKKSYRDNVAEMTRLSLIYATKLLEKSGAAFVSDRIEIPDFVKRASRPRLAIKSVSALGRAEVFLAAEPSIAPVLLIRHPCGFVSSMLRGKSLGLMDPVQGLGQLAKTSSATRMGLKNSMLSNADEIELLAWTWLVSNAEATPAIERAKGTILIYDQVASEPALLVKLLFERLGLGWPAQTEQFLSSSQNADGDYYSVFRNSKDIARRWREELDGTTIDRIRSIVSRDPLGAQFFQS